MDFEDLLRQDMDTVTSGLHAPAALLAGAAARGRARRRRRRVLLVLTPTVAAVALTAALAHGLTGPSGAAQTLTPATRSAAPVVPEVAAWPGWVADPGPDDAALLRAEWVGVANRSHQAGGSTTRTEERWYGRNGLTYGNLTGKLILLQNGDAPRGKRNPGVMVGGTDVDFAGVLALPADPVALAARLSPAPGEQGDLDAAHQALSLLLQGWAPLTTPVRCALVQIMASSPHVTVEPARTDSLGRRAALYTVTGTGATDDQVYVDPVTCRVLEHLDIAVGGPRALPTEGPPPAGAPLTPGSVHFRDVFYNWGTGAPTAAAVPVPPAPPAG